MYRAMVRVEFDLIRTRFWKKAPTACYLFCMGNFGKAKYFGSTRAEVLVVWSEA